MPKKPPAKSEEQKAAEAAEKEAKAIQKASQVRVNVQYHRRRTRLDHGHVTHERHGIAVTLFSPNKNPGICRRIQMPSWLIKGWRRRATFVEAPFIPAPSLFVMTRQ